MTTDNENTTTAPALPPLAGSLLGRAVVSDFAGEGFISEISDEHMHCDFQGWTYSGDPSDLGKPGKPRFAEQQNVAVSGSTPKPFSFPFPER